MLPILPSSQPAILVLADGTVFHGHACGALGHTVGEVVFNTGITGYQEILTDPSYAQQIVTLTYPHIGNVGINPEDGESDRVQAAGLIVRDVPNRASNFRMHTTLSAYLREQNIVAISGIDTRHLTGLLREKGAQNGCIIAGEVDVDKALTLARGFSGLAGKDVAQDVTTATPYTWKQTEWCLGSGYGQLEHTQYRVVAFDYGIKHNILRKLASLGCEVTVLPAKTTAQQALDYHPDGIFLSNGPGDPQACDYAIESTRVLLESGIPMFGICLGHQIMALALGAKTLKMKTGHHGTNHPVKDILHHRVMISSQNHGFVVDPASLPANTRITHHSLFDGTLQGFELTDRPAFCFQGHPEASPGPHDLDPLFAHFIALMQQKSA
jgi:carbamoyl-phosphate synthase small subunit